MGENGGPERLLGIGSVANRGRATIRSTSGAAAGVGLSVANRGRATIRSATRWLA